MDFYKFKAWSVVCLALIRDTFRSISKSVNAAALPYSARNELSQFLFFLFNYCVECT